MSNKANPRLKKLENENQYLNLYEKLLIKYLEFNEKEFHLVIDCMEEVWHQAQGEKILKERGE